MQRQLPAVAQQKILCSQRALKPPRTAGPQSCQRKLRSCLMQPMGPAIRLGAAWVAFLALLTYLVVTIATVSHKDLLLNSPVTLPVINANIPIVGFFQRLRGC